MSDRPLDDPPSFPMWTVEPTEPISTEKFQEVMHEILWDGPCSADCPCRCYPFISDTDESAPYFEDTIMVTPQIDVPIGAVITSATIEIRDGKAIGHLKIRRGAAHD